MCAWLEDQTDRYLYSVVELRAKLLEMGYSDDEVYIVATMKNVTLFTASHRVVKAAAKLIRAEIREKEYNTEQYPTPQDISDPVAAKKYVQKLLLSFLQELVRCDIKQIAIANAVLQAARPRSVISPVPLGVGVQMDHAYGSAWLVNELARLGFSVSSDKVCRFKQSVMHQEQSQVSVMACYPGRFTQWIGDKRT